MPFTNSARLFDTPELLMLRHKSADLQKKAALRQYCAVMWTLLKPSMEGVFITTISSET